MLPNQIRSYTIIKKLGEGAFSKVFKVWDRDRNDFCAMKIIKGEELRRQPKALELLQREINILSKCKNQNVIKLYESFIENGEYHLVLEFCNGGDVEQLMKTKKNNVFSETEAISYMRQILNGFKGLHEIGAMHRDFKPANILLHDGLIKIADLGFGTQNDLAKTALGTSLYMAPEIIEQKKYNNKVDIWSIGVCFYQMLTGIYPFYARTESKLLNDIITNDINFNIKNIKLSDPVIDLIKRMLTYSPIKRIEWNQLYNHEVFKEKQGLLQSVAIFANKELVLKQNIDKEFSNNRKFYENYEEKELIIMERDNELDEKPIYFNKKQEDINKKEKEKQWEIEKEKQIKKEREEELKKNEIEEKFKRIAKEKVENEIMEQQRQMNLIEQKYLHFMHIVSQHAIVLKESMVTFEIKNIILFFFFAKKTLKISKKFFFDLTNKINRFNSDYFQYFIKNLLYEEFKKNFNYQLDELKAYLISLLCDINENKNESEYNIFKNEINEDDDKGKLDEFLKQKIIDVSFELFAAKNKNNYKKQVIIINQLFDCFNWEKKFLFNEKEKDGFDFEHYKNKLEEMPIERLEETLQSNVQSLYD